MSANNFYRVMKFGGRYAVEMGWMEDDAGLEDTPDEERAVWFDSLDEAMKYASSEYSEYGVTYEDGDSGA